MSFTDLRDLVAHLETRGQLRRIAAPVSRDLEITEITDRVSKSPGDRNVALLFERVEGFDMKPTVAETLESAQGFYGRGFRHFGLKIGVDPKQDLANVRALRDRFGDGVVIRVDANGALTYDDALALLRKLEPYDIDAAEQPIAIWDLDGLAALARATTIPIMRYDARRFKKAARSISAQATTRSRTSPLRKAHIVDRFTRRFWMFSGLNWSR